MTRAIGPQDPEALRAEAADWFVRSHSDAAGENDWLALEEWLAGSAARRAALGEVERLWDELDEHAAELRNQLEPPIARVSRPPRRAWAPWPAWAIAASLPLVALGLWLLRPARPPAQVFATAIGETRAILLPDGSRVELNSASRVLARVDRRHRRVTLESGEAVFDVAKDQAHPFVVTVGDQQVTVVGTQFDILRLDGRIEVTVSRGLVEVRPAPGVGGHPSRLSPGQQLRRREGSPTSEVSQVPVEDVLAWRQGYLVYRGRPLAEVAADLSRYFATPVAVEGPAADLAFTGVLRLDDEDRVLRRLQSFLPIRADRAAGRITLRSR